jgi:hypothetical protein
MGKNKVSLETVRKANQNMINNSKVNDPNFMDITKIVFREIGGRTYKLSEQKNLLPEHNVNGMILIDGRFFEKYYY